MKKPDLRGRQDTGRCLCVAASCPDRQLRAELGQILQGELQTLVRVLPIPGLEGCCHRSPMSTVQGCRHLRSVEHHCLVSQVCESTRRGAAPGGTPHPVRPGMGSHLAAGSQPVLMGPQQMQGQPRRPGVPGKVMARRKTWESHWVQAPAQA